MGLLSIVALLGHAVAETYPTASAWRVVNAECVDDHWRIGELDIEDTAQNAHDNVARGQSDEWHPECSKPPLGCWADQLVVAVVVRAQVATHWPIS